MEYLFVKLYFAHALGDYFTQSRSMALKKSEKNWRGAIVCAIHSLIYTFFVCLLTGYYRADIVALVFISHFPIDYWSLGGFWLKLIRGRDILKSYQSQEQYHEIDLIFSCIVYKEVDNKLHLMLLFLIFAWYI